MSRGGGRALSRIYHTYAAKAGQLLGALGEDVSLAEIDAAAVDR